MNTDLNERQINLNTANQRMGLIQDRSEVAAQTPKNSLQITSDFNQFYYGNYYR